MSDNKSDGAKIVSAAILGFDFRRIVVNNVSYVIKPPTIHTLVSATYWLTEIEDADTIKGSLQTLNSLDNACRALSCFIQGNDGIWEELSHGTMNEIVDGLEAGFDLIDMQNFLKLSALMRSAKRLIAKPR